MKQKLLSKLLAIAMVLTLLPAGVFAADDATAANDVGPDPTPTVENVAEVGGTKYETLQAAIDKAAKNATVTLLADTRENVTINKAMTLDLNGHTLNGSTGERKPALTITARTVTIKDSSEAQTGTIMREDTAENSGVSSHYVIDIQGNAWVKFESGKVKNNSGNTVGKGASLVRIGDDSVKKQPGLVINGGTFTQDNFIVIKVDRGYLTLNDGTLTSANSYAVENWFSATIKGGTVNGAVSSWTYSGGSNSTLTISGGKINGNVESVSYDGAEGKLAKVKITGGTVNGTLIAGINNDSTTDPAKATIEVTGGTFDKDPSKYVTEDAKTGKNGDGTFGVSKVYLCKIGDTGYYTMDEAFKAQTTSGEPVVLLRDYTTGGTFNSGSINRTVDLNGYTWTYTGTNVNDAAFEINYPDVTLTVKNGKIVSGSMVGLIPSAMGGKIKYDNSGLVFEDVEATANGHSGIETNGNNTNDSVTLKNSTLNVPNGFGIYFPSSGTLTIDNSTINAKTMGVQVCAGSLNINDGSKITVTGDAVPKTESDGAIQDGAAISIVNRTGYKGLGKIEVTGGSFKAKAGNAAIKAYDWQNQTESNFTADKGTVAVSGGTFTSDPSAYCATGKTGIVSGNVYTVGDIATNVEVAPAAPAASAATDGKKEEVATAMKSAATAIGSDNTTVEGLTAVGGTEASKVTTDDVTKAAEDLKAAGVTPSEGQPVTVYVQPYLDIKVTDAKIDSSKTTELTMEINPMVKKVASTATNAKDIKLPTDEGTTNAKVLSTEKVTVTTPVTITIPLPTGLVSDTTKPIYIKHVKENGATFVYEATVTETSGTYYATFTNPNGFSTFTVTATNPAVAKIGSVGYTTLQAAVDAAKDGETVEIVGGTTPYTATMSGSSRTITVKNTTSGEIKVTINGTKETIAIEKTATFSYTAPVYTPITKKDVKFDDVDVNAYYAPAVKWAVENKITAGKTDKLFAPDDTCTRGEMITFLWNAAGKPAAKNTTNPFTDVNVGAFYYDAVLWAVENGITSGTTDTTFSPDNTVSRAQVVAFLYNYANKPAAANSTFSDVAADAYYAPAVGWAAAQKITSGTGNNTFSPENDCTRAQIVTFLYNDLAK